MVIWKENVPSSQINILYDNGTTAGYIWFIQNMAVLGAMETLKGYKLVPNMPLIWTEASKSFHMDMEFYYKYLSNTSSYA